MLGKNCLFDTVLEWFTQKISVNSSFEGNKGIFTFTNSQNGKTLSTQPIQKAYYRYQLKLGTTKKGLPGIRAERAFTQDHPASSTMAAQIQKIKRDMEKAMGGKVDVEVRMPATRNLPGGAFSDTIHMKTSSGLVKDAHIIPKPMF